MSSPKFPSLPVFLVDDEIQALQSFEITLRGGGINNIISCQDSENVIPILSEQEIGVILLDLWMPKVSGEEILSKVVQEFPEIPIIIITGVDKVETAVRCMKNGAFDYMVKPVEKGRLVTGVGLAIELRELRHENTLLKQRVLSKELEYPSAFSEIITENETMVSIFQYIEAIAKTSQPVLITGETGTGKELIARAIHNLGGHEGSFVPVNAAGLDDQIFADTLFGHRRGAFTGADTIRTGMVEQASNGTLFLDEIGDLTVTSQVKLLRLLQEHEYLPLGSDVPKRSNSRVIVATNQDIHALQKSGKFRKDLYYRLCTHHVHIPPLRERMDDLLILVEHFIFEASQELKKKQPSYPKELIILLGTYNFPGNIRELKSMIYDAMSNHKSGMLSMGIFKIALGLENWEVKKVREQKSLEKESSISFKESLPTLRQAEQLLVSEALKRSKGNQTIAAKMLGITRQALNRRLKKRK
ncbi:sigma-54-dependent transcriptional regulator [candidate division CSSED10-310 bacterium]|uniref:Sigma-54-dependent transcriptional regulator n=1 Tax=candidate division CSSED10-310 bacterium TaxID=2855610 RepID=A0ABV6Z5H4_UNCC1